MLLLRHQSTGIDVDISLGALPYEEDLIRRADSVEVQGLSLRVSTPEDLVIMKWLAHRPRDLQDVEGILDAKPQLNVAFIRQMLVALSELSTEFDLIGEFESLLVRKKRHA